MREFELESGEQVVLEVRKHWFLFASSLLPFAILAILPLALPHILGYAPPLAPLIASFNYSLPLARVVLGVWWLLVWSAAFNSFTKYFLNLWVLTNLRVIEIEQHAFFNREVSSLFLNRIEDVTTDTVGAVNSFLDIGTINVQTAGAVERFTMRGIPHPATLRDTMLKYAAVHNTAPEGPGQ